MSQIIKMTAGIGLPELETIEQEKSEMTLGDKVCLGFLVVGVFYFGVHFLIYFYRLSHGQIPGLS